MSLSYIVRGGLWGSVRRTGRTGLLIVGIVLEAGCASDTTGPTAIDPAHLYYQLTLNHHAMTMALTAPYNTLQLTATPTSATGVPLADTGMTIWTSSDTTSVRVSSTGVVTAIATTTQVVIAANHTINGVTHGDTALVNVNDTASIPHMTRLTIQPTPSFGTFPYYDLYGFMQFAAAALDAQGDTIPNVLVDETAATPDVMWNRSKSRNSWWTGPGSVFFIRGPSTGHARIVAEATVYGVRLVDTLPFTIGWWHHIVVGVHATFPSGTRTPIGTFVPAEDTVAVGGAVIWRNVLPQQMPVDIVFDSDNPSPPQAVDSATFLGGFACQLLLCVPTQGGGNIPSFAPMDSAALLASTPDTLGVRARSFPLAGIYHYHSTLYGTSGVIHVLPEFQIP